MFTSFFYLLRQRGLRISLNEWLTLMDGLEKGLHDSSLTGFYHLCRTVLVKSEADYDCFDQTFLEFFGDMSYKSELPENILQWLENPSEDLCHFFEEPEDIDYTVGESESLLAKMEERLKAQKKEHNGGRFWLGTQGYTPWGNSGWHPNGIRIGGDGRHRTAIMVAGERTFRDFRKDNVLDTRQFQMAFRLLRQLSDQADDRDKVLDIKGTIRETCDNAGTLKLRYMNARKNTVKVLLLMDSGGSMEYYASLCSRLFQAATKSNHFKEVQTYYFHNCIYSSVYKNPTLQRDSAVSTDWLLQKYDSSYKVILVGDAEMNPHELMEPRFNWNTREYGPSGMEWLLKLKGQYPYLIWLNPKPLPTGIHFWSRTHLRLAEMFNMYELSVEGLEQGMKQLMARRK